MLLTILLYLAIIIAVLALVTVLFLRLAPQLGGTQTGERLRRIERSEQYRDGHFRNRLETPMGLPQGSRSNVMKEYFLGKEERVPKDPLPSVRPAFASGRDNGKEKGIVDVKGGTDDRTGISITWLGHSTVLIRMNGFVLLTDPIFGKRISPLPFIGPKTFLGSSPLEVSDIPPLDAVIISHDHYDHLEHSTIRELISRTKLFFVPLGVGAHLERWGVPSEKIVELDWWEEAELASDGSVARDNDRGEEGEKKREKDIAEEKGEVDETRSIQLIAAPARHFSGRKFTEMNSTLWSSWIIKTGDQSLFFGGDSGYTEEFAEIGNRYGPFDVTMLDCGQYSVYWSDIHMLPEQTIQAHLDLQGEVLLPIHWGKLNLSIHPWFEPIERVTGEAERREVTVTTPKIGETLLLGKEVPQEKWWNPT